MTYAESLLTQEEHHSHWRWCQNCFLACLSAECRQVLWGLWRRYHARIRVHDYVHLKWNRSQNLIHERQVKGADGQWESRWKRSHWERAGWVRVGAQRGLELVKERRLCSSSGSDAGLVPRLPQQKAELEVYRSGWSGWNWLNAKDQPWLRAFHCLADEVEMSGVVSAARMTQGHPSSEHKTVTIVWPRNILLSTSREYLY